jgi:hypothetical protein
MQMQQQQELMANSSWYSCGKLFLIAAMLQARTNTHVILMKTYLPIMLDVLTPQLLLEDKHININKLWIGLHNLGICLFRRRSTACGSNVNNCAARCWKFTFFQIFLR